MAIGGRLWRRSIVIIFLVVLGEGEWMEVFLDGFFSIVVLSWDLVLGKSGRQIEPVSIVYEIVDFDDTGMKLNI
jgi:hypothetical protein